LILSHYLGRLLDRLDHLDVTAAAADVAGDSFADLELTRIRVLIQQPLGRKQHTGRAKTTLDSRIVDERLLERVKTGHVTKTLDSENILAFGADCQIQAGIHRLAIDQYGASSAFSSAAALFCAGQANLFTDHIEQPVFYVNCQRIVVAIHLQTYVLFHGLTPLPAQ